MKNHFLVHWFSPALLFCRGGGSFQNGPFRSDSRYARDSRESKIGEKT